MEKETRGAIERATQRARQILEADFSEQLQGAYDVMLDGRVGESAGAHLAGRQKALRARIAASIQHKRMAGMQPKEAVADYLRDAAFTTLNRFVALKMLEARGLVQECITKGDASSGFVNEYLAFAPGAKFPDGRGYRLYIESIFDEMSTEIKVLFDRRDPAAALWPRRAAFEEMLAVLNAVELSSVWAEDETIGWVYQYFNSGDERRKMREESQAPRNSRELAVRNQFFTPRYVVQFLSDNTLGRIWYEMRKGDTRLIDVCEYMVRPHDEILAAKSDSTSGKDNLVAHRPAKDPRDLRVLDPACGSGHFLLYCFLLLLVVYEEGWKANDAPKSEVTGRTLREDYSAIDDLRRAMPSLILLHNLHGVDIDPRCAQIAQLALWMRAQRAYQDLGIERSARPIIRRSNIVIAEPMPGDAALVEEFAATLNPPLLGHLFKEMVAEMTLAGEMGSLLPIERRVAFSIDRARKAFVEQRQRNAQGFLPSLAPERRQIELDLTGIDDDAFLDHAEDSIFDALKVFVADAVNGVGARRRLFADDAEQGIAFIDVSRKQFDVALMNPPFGAPTPSTAQRLTQKHCQNLYSAFVSRAVELGASYVGAITDRTFLTQNSFSAYREYLLDVDHQITALADLGWGVLDANVQTCAYVIAKDPPVKHAAFIDIKIDEEKAAKLRDPAAFTRTDLTAFANLPDSVIAHNIPASILNVISTASQLKTFSDLPRGLGSNDAKRTFRCWYEVPLTSGEQEWVSLANGGEHAPFWRDNKGVALWRSRDGRLLAQHLKGDSGAIYDQAGVADYFRPGLNYPKRAASLNVALIPDGYVPTREGKAITPVEPEDGGWLLGYLNSRFIQSIVRDTIGLHKQSGAVRSLPMLPFDGELKGALKSKAMEIASVIRALSRADETSREFVLPVALLEEPTADEVRPRLERLLDEIDALVISAVSTEIPEGWLAPRQELSLFQAGENDMISWAVGAAFGRFDVGLAIGERPIPPPRHPAQDVSVASPGMLNEGMPSNLHGGILVEDFGSPLDLPDLVAQVLESVGSPIGREEVRSYISKEFFVDHIGLYTDLHRKAPIWWQISVPSRKFAIWISAHALSDDVLYRCRADHLRPRIVHEQTRLESLKSDLEKGIGSASVAATSQSLLDELRDLDDKLAVAASLWKPNIADGVLITCAPLWDLFSCSRVWQRDLYAAWVDLCSGKYDWSGTAMYIWPERVVAKCADNRGIAIAHDLEDVFWREDEGGKWKRREIPLRSVDQLVAEKSSPSIKDALKRLGDASTPIASAKRGRNVKAK